MINADKIIAQVGRTAVSLDDALRALCLQYANRRISIDVFADTYEALLCRAAGLTTSQVDDTIADAVRRHPPLGSADAE